MKLKNKVLLKKKLFLKNIRLLYLKEKGRYNGDLEEIRANADSIFEHIQRKLWDQANEEINEIDEKVFSEAIDSAITIILTDAFMRCEILEEPTR